MTKIRIVAPAKYIEKEHILFSKHFLEQEGYSVEISKHCLGQYNYFSGTDADRLSDFQNALDDNSVDVILCARGGYGIVRIIDELDFTNFKIHPKKIVGYSDVTVFHNHIVQKFNIPTIHATVPLNFKNNTKESLKSLINAIDNNKNEYKLKPYKLNICGKVTAKLVGGNLAILYSLIGTNSDINIDNCILFIEDVGESIYAIDRMFWSLKKANKLNKVKGLIVGGFTNIGDSEKPFGKSVEEVILEHFKPLKIPIAFNFPAGHINDNRALVLGKKAVLNVTTKAVVFKQ